MTARYFSRHTVDRIIAVLLTVGLFAVQLYRWRMFRFTTFDLGVFEQVVWKMANGHGATSTLTSWNTFADHLSPVLVLFIPLYWISATPVWFFAAQALAMGVAALCVRPLVTAVGLTSERIAAVLVVAYALQPAIWNAAVNAFHPTTLAVPALLIGCTAALRHRYRDLWIVALVLVLLRDDLALAMIPLAIVGWRSADAKGRRIRMALMACGAGWTVFGAQLGEAMGASRHFEYRYGYLGDSMIGAALNPLRSAIGLAEHVFTADTALFLLATLVPLALLPLAKPGWALLAGFMALPSLAADDTFLHSPAFHYGAPLVPFVLLAAAGALATSRAEARRRASLVLGPVAFAGLCIVGPGLTNVFAPSTFAAADARAALATIAADDHVVASHSLGSYVADRVNLGSFPYPFVEHTPNFPLDPDVTTTAPSAQRAVDVVVVQKPSKPDSVFEEFLEAPVIQREFRREDFGTVLVFRRITP